MTDIDDVITVVRDECDFKADVTTKVKAAGWQSKLEKDRIEKALNVE